VGVTAYFAMGELLFFPSSRENISQPGIKSPTPPFKFGYPSTTKGFFFFFLKINKLSYQVGKLVKESKINVVSRHSNQQCFHIEM
jgi:hypothetical protein